MEDRNKFKNGFTLIETLLAIGIFSIIVLGIYFSYSNILDVIISSQAGIVSQSVIDNELEIIRNMKFEDVGTQGGSPAGLLQAEKVVQQSGASFLVKTFVRNVDDPFDGTIGGTPNDLAPADYKLVEIELSCPLCPRFTPRVVTTRVAPTNLENSTKNGALFINVFDAAGQPISGANVNVRNNFVIPNININDVTGVNGSLQLVDIATSSAKYEITITKTGYSDDRTYQPGDVLNPNPTKPHATVANQTVTQISFAIDRESILNLSTADQFCVAVPNIDYTQIGAKLIGTDPDVQKYLQNHVTNTSGIKTISDLEWDAYSFQNTDLNYDIAGMSIINPVIINPNTTYNLKWVMESKNPSSILITVQDGDGQFINDASVQLTKTGFDQTKLSGQRNIVHTEWAGQGQLMVPFDGSKYSTASHETISNTIDFGTPNTTFFNMIWNPVSQDPATGPNSLKFQIATNNDNSTWNYVGPDGTAGSFYTNSGTGINPIHNGNRYFRYKAILQTVNDQYTPMLDDITIAFRSSCGLDGQAFFSGLTTDTYTLTIQKTGYTTHVDPSVIINSNWKSYNAVLLP